MVMTKAGVLCFHQRDNANIPPTPLPVSFMLPCSNFDRKSMMLTTI